MKKVIGSLSLLLLMSCFVFAGDETINSYRHFTVNGGEVEPNEKELQDFPTTVAPTFPEQEEPSFPVVEERIEEEEGESDLERALRKNEEATAAQENNIQEALKEEVENAVKEEKDEFTIALEKFMKQNLFDFDSDKILEDNHANLDLIAEFLKEYENMTIKIEGHTDNVGTEEYNKDLSERRANAVKNYLVEKGINENRITTEGFGFSKPIADNDTEEGQAKNRRTEVIFKLQDGSVVGSSDSESVNDVLKKEVENAIKNDKEDFKIALDKFAKESLFEFGSATIMEENFANLDAIADFLKENDKISVKIEGHTDNVGSEEYNKGLSERRAKSVGDYLIEKGVDSSRVETEGCGFSKPIASNDTEEGQAKNRRTEIIFKIQK